jgi:hypothetical protein
MYVNNNKKRPKRKEKKFTPLLSTLVEAAGNTHMQGGW